MTLKLQVLGPGCARCKTLASFAGVAARELALDFTLEKVTELSRLMDLGVMATPALVVNGSVKVIGRVPGIPELKTILQQSAAENLQPERNKNQQ